MSGFASAFELNLLEFLINDVDLGLVVVIVPFKLVELLLLVILIVRECVVWLLLLDLDFEFSSRHVILDLGLFLLYVLDLFVDVEPCVLVGHIYQHLALLYVSCLPLLTRL